MNDDARLSIFVVVWYLPIPNIYLCEDKFKTSSTMKRDDFLNFWFYFFQKKKSSLWYTAQARWLDNSFTGRTMLNSFWRDTKSYKVTYFKVLLLRFVFISIRMRPLKPNLFIKCCWIEWYALCFIHFFTDWTWSNNIVILFL